MSFYLKYELSRLLHSDGAKTFQAIEKSSRQNVLLHLVDKTASPELVEQVKHLESGESPDLVEVGEFAGSYYVVTRPIEDFQGLKSWLDAGAAGASAPAAAPEPDPQPSAEQTQSPPPASEPDPPATEEPGEFTQLFGGASEPPAESKPEPPPPTAPTMLDPEPAPPATPKPAAPAPETPSARPEPDAQQPGEFTRLFGGEPATESSQPSSAGKPVPAAEPPVSTDGPGEFTQLFGAAQEEESAPQPPPESLRPAAPEPRPPQNPPPAPPADAENPGEFTRLFGESRQSSPPQAPEARSAAASEPSEPPAQPRPKGPETPSSGTPVEKESGEFTRLFGEGASESAPRLKPTRPPQGGDLEKSSGEFTRLFGPGGKGAKPAQPSKSAPPPKPHYAPEDEPLGSSAGGPGEFTRMFGGGASGSSGSPSGSGGGKRPRSQPPSFGEGLVGEISGDEALSPERSTAASKSSKPFQAPGEFTRMFGSSDPSRQQAQDFVPAAQKGGEGYASGLFRNPNAEPRTPPPTNAQPAGGEGSSAPGEYTKMFERGQAQQTPQPQQAPQPQPAAPPAGSTPAEPAKSGPGKGMLIALVAAVIVAGLSLGAAVYLFLNRDSSAEPAEPPAVEQPAEQPSESN